MFTTDLVNPWPGQSDLPIGHCVIETGVHNESACNTPQGDGSALALQQSGRVVVGI